MAENVFEILVTEQPALAEKLQTNHDVSDFLYAAYAHLLNIAIESSNDPKNMIVFVDIQQDKLLRLQVQYYKDGSNTGEVGSKLPSKRNLNLVNFLKVNGNMRTLAQRVVEVMERWVNSTEATKSQGFSKIVTRNSTLWRETKTITAELMVKFQFDEFVNAKMKWDMDEPDTPPIDLEWKKEQVK
jgi:hypothetical protein